MGKLLQATSRLSEALRLMGAAPKDAFPRVLRRVVTKMMQNDEELFNEDEQAKLCELLSLGEADLKKVLAACQYIFEQCVYHNAKAGALEAQLNALGTDADLASTFESAWEAQGASLVESMATRPFGATPTLSAVDRNLALQMASSGLGRRKDPTTVFEFKLKQSDDKGGVTEDSKVVEFDYDQLFDFFQDIEQVQAQLDAMN